MQKIFIFLLLCVSMINAQNKLNGNVKNTNGENLSGVNIFISELQKGTVSDIDGNYEITNIPSGSFNIQFSYIGYKTVIKKIDFKKNTVLNIKMVPTDIEIGEVIVLGNSVQSAVKIPYKIESISIKQIHSDGYVTLVQSLSDLPGVSTFSNGLGISKPVIRGMFGYRIATVIDGIRFDNQQWQNEHGFGLNDIGIGKVEIIEGPASLLYGADALGGVVKIENEKNAPAGKILGNYNLKIFSNTLGANTSLGFKGAGEKLSWQIYAGAESHADYLDGTGEKVPNTRFGGFSGKGILHYSYLWGNTSLNYNFSHHIYGVVEAGELNNPKEKQEDHFEREFEGPHHTIDFHIASLKNIFFAGDSKFKINVGYQNNHRKEQEGEEEKTSGEEDELDIILNTFSYDGEWIYPFSNNTELTIGSQGYFQKYENEGGRVLIPNGNLGELSLFAYAKHSFEKVELTGGIRFDAKEIESEMTENKDSTEFPIIDNSYDITNGAVGISYEAVENLFLKINFATGYRAPNLAELTSNGVHEGTVRYEIGNPTMESEKSYQTDLGLNYQIENFILSVNLFYNKVANYIFLQPTQDFIGSNRVYRFMQEDASLKGGEIGFNFKPVNWFDFGSSFSSVIGKKDDDRFLPFMPADKIISKIKFDFSELTSLENFIFSISIKNYLKQTNTASEEIPTPAYTLIDAGVGSDVFLFGLKLEAALNVTNLFDKKYYSHLSLLKSLGVLNMGRNISLSLNIPFTVK